MTTTTSLPIVQMQGRFLFTTEQQQQQTNDNNENDGNSTPNSSSSSTTTTTRFVMKGIAFPNAPLKVDPDKEGAPARPWYNPAGWIAVLKQLRHAMPSFEALNVIRLYDLDILQVDYQEFFHASDALGFYTMVPLTSSQPKTSGLLNRALVAPECYPRELFDYGRQALQHYLQFPNVAAALVGNEVMNAQESWPSAPCLAAYARDLKRFQQELAQEIINEFHANKTQTLYQRYRKRIVVNETTQEPKLLPIPLMYAAQDSGLGAALGNVDALRLTMDYLSCSAEDDDEMDKKEDLGIDIFGVNVESWCSSTNQYEFNDDGTMGSFYKLQQGLQTNQHSALVFSELGCSHYHYNRDAPAGVLKEVRDWNEVPVVLQEMANVWSGYCAYAYWGNPLFNMMDQGPWDGQHVLPIGPDFHNFQLQSNQAAKIPISFPKESTTTTAIDASRSKTASSITGGVAASIVIPEELPMANGGVMQKYYQALHDMKHQAIPCTRVEKALNDSCLLNLYPLSQMPKYSTDEGSAMFVDARLYAPSSLDLSKYGISTADTSWTTTSTSSEPAAAWNGTFAWTMGVLFVVVGSLWVLFVVRPKGRGPCSLGRQGRRDANYTELP